MTIDTAVNVADSCFTVDQFSELRNLEKLSIAAGGPGFKSEVQALIARLTTAGATARKADPRIAQAKKLWRKGWGRELGFKKFELYLATIPEIPASLLADNPTFPLLVLVDPRLGHVKSARLAGLKFEEYGNTDKTLEPFDARHTMPTTPYWVRAHDGSPNLNRKPSDIRKGLVGNQLAGTADVGIAIWIQHGKRNHVMDLPGSVYVSGRGRCACLDVWDDVAELGAGRSDGAVPRYGSVVFVCGV